MLLFSVVLLLITFSIPAHALYERQTDQGSIDLRGLVRVFGTANKYPDNKFFYEDEIESGVAAIARLIMHAQAGQHLGFELNAYQTLIPNSMVSRQASLGTPLDVERNSSPEGSFSNDRYAHLAIDRLNARWSHDRLDLIIGRQPVNLATTFYFTPNDFFAPFAAQTFYRVYKPGVDAARAEVRLGDLSQLSLIGVLGYRRDPSGDTGWKDYPDSDRASYLGRVSTVFHDFEWAILGGVVRDDDVIGGSLQGELFQWLGVRSEGHITYPDDPQLFSRTDLSFGIEHRWESSLNMRLEHFYHSSGAGSVAEYSTIGTTSQGESGYLGRNYTAFGISYEFTPLMNAQMLAIANLTDHSCLLSFNSVYSLSDEAELTINLGVPLGDKPEGAEIKSEFGLYPWSMNVEVRSYF